MGQWLVGIGGSLGAVLLMALVAWAGSDQGVTALGIPIFLLCGIFALAVQWLVFIHAWRNQTEHFYDLTGSLTYIVTIAAALLMAGRFDTPSLIIAVVIWVWALRLGPFLFFRIRKAGEDRRFRTIKVSFPTFFMTWTLQGAWVFITASAALGALTSSVATELGFVFYLGLALWLIGFVIEVVADQQKTAFRADPANANAFITTGLWAWSRHPNYFGEITLWVGVAIMALPALQGNQLFLMLSPLWVIFLLTAVSGIRMLENRGRKQWGDDPEYQAYVNKTPALMLWPPRA
ncbi:MAG TPA: hypothetical protein DCP57_12005 [Gammaproteobacteria bacterium]|nr:MAG: DUF1295 domain-containing protein [OM182 bacterium]HAL43163.1 hypothetical protein [Gammaproteobacteria bacterium]|tara:strand:+ start:1200 stop:2072 length:873 start_codon:yes stop_codon:yes gene_type:complete